MNHTEHCPMSKELSKSEELVKLCAKYYFIKFGYTRVETLNKTSGEQQGCRVKVNGSDEVVFYVKTHQMGAKQTIGWQEPFSGRELLIYKVFELMGLGPKVWWFKTYLCKEQMYIATQNPAFSLERDRVVGRFVTADALCTAEGAHYDMWKKELLSKDRYALKYHLLLELLQSLLHISDLSTNPGNYGVLQQEGKEKWLIIDFRVGLEKIFEQQPLPVTTQLKLTTESFPSLEQTEVIECCQFANNVLSNGTGGEKRTLGLLTALDETIKFMNVAGGYYDMEDKDDVANYCIEIKNNLEKWFVCHDNGTD
jgi:hypothetical protein